MHTAKSYQLFTFVWHHISGLHVHLAVLSVPHLGNIIAHLVAAVLTAAQAHTFVESLLGVTAVCHAVLVLVDKGVNEEVDGTLMGTFYNLVHV